MAIFVFTGSPQVVWEKIRAAIGQGRIETWEIDTDNDLTHSPPQWKNKAWFRCYVNNDKLSFALFGVKGIAMTKVVYGVYHGRLIETLLAHFDTEFSSISATASRAQIDRFS